MRERERDRLRIAPGRRLFDDGPAGKAQTEELRDLVEGLAGSVVARLADQRVLERRPRVVERGVPARDDEGEEGVRRRVIGEERGVDVALEVVDADERR